MKTKFVWIALLFAFTAFYINAAENNLKGTWKLLSTNDQVVPFNQVKLITEGHFMWSVFDNEGKMLRAAGGKVTMTEKGIYTETIAMGFGGMEQLVGQIFTLEYEIKDKKMYVKVKAGQYSMNEVWEKID